MINYSDEGRSLHKDYYRADIDGIRAVAVLSVVLSHAFPSILPGGFVGVDVFFVISGYLISGILIKELNADRFSVLNFYTRRVLRIFPALLLVMTFVLILGWICLFKPEFKSLGYHTSTSALFSENFLLWSESGYFDASSKLKPLLHLWSLAIEEQFYIFWPILMWIAFRLRLNFILIIAALFLISFAINLRDIYIGSTAAYYSPFGRSWELMVGSALAYAKTSKNPFFINYKNFLSTVGVLLLGLGFVFIGPDNGFPGFWALLPTLGASLLLAASEDAWFNLRVLSTAPLVWCGLISYPLYLWHWPFLSFGYFIFGGLSFAKSTVCVIAAVVAAFLTYFIVERPIRRRRKKENLSLYLVSGMGFVVMSGLLIATEIVLPRLKSFDVPTGNEWEILTALAPTSDEKEPHIRYLHPERPKQILFIGDSHIAQYATRLNKLIEQDIKRPGAVLAVLPGCIPIEKTDGKYRDMCWPMKERAYALAKQTQFETIVIGGAWFIYFSEAGKYFLSEEGRVSLTTVEGRQLALAQLKKSIAEFRQMGKKVIILLDNPVSDLLNPTGPHLRLSTSTKNFEPNGSMELDSWLYDMHQDLVAWAMQTGARVIDPMKRVCSFKICAVTTDTGQPIYRNRDHFNRSWVTNHANFIDSIYENDG